MNICNYCGKETSNPKYCGSFCANRGKHVKKYHLEEVQANKKLFRKKESFSNFLNLVLEDAPENFKYIYHRHYKIKVGKDSFPNQKYISEEELVELKKEKNILEGLRKEEKFHKEITKAARYTSGLFDKYKYFRKGTKPEILFFNFLVYHDLKQRVDFYYQYKCLNYTVDFYFPKLNLGLEIDGDYWHANPKKYKEDQIIRYPQGKFTAKEIWEKDRIRENKLKDHMNIYRIWECDILDKSFEEKADFILESIMS